MSTRLYPQFFDVVLCLLSSLVTAPILMSISSLVLELWQFSYIRDWPEIWKSEIPPSEFFPISGDWGKLGIPNSTRMFNVWTMVLNGVKQSIALHKKAIQQLSYRLITIADYSQWFNRMDMYNIVMYCNINDTKIRNTISKFKFPSKFTLSNINCLKTHWKWIFFWAPTFKSLFAQSAQFDFLLAWLA